MIKMGKKILSIFIVLIFLSSPAFAEILLFQPSSIYNFGDTIDVSAVLKETSEKSGFLELNLVCGNEIQNFHKEFVSLKPNEEKTIYPSSLPVDISIFSATSKNCKISAKFLDETTETPSFQISTNINIFPLTQDLSANPSENFILKGNAKKENGKEVEGFVEVLISSLNINIKKQVNKGSFEVNFSIPENAKAGNHLIILDVYELDKTGERNNEGELSLNLKIKSKPTSVDIALEKQSLQPPYTFKFKPLVLDQAGDVVTGDVLVRISDSKGNLILEDIISSNTEKSIDIKNNAVPGYWEIKFSFSVLESSRLFYIEELEKASFTITNESLIITNEGNVPYKKAVQIFIGDKREIKEVDLEVGESKQFFISAPDGEYDVRVTDGENEYSQKVALTGNIVKISESKRKFSFSSQYPLMWIFLIVVAGIFVLAMYERVRKKSSYSFPVEEKKEKKKSISIKSDYADLSGGASKAEHSLVLQGNKEESCIVALKVENLNEKEKNAKETFEKIMSLAKEYKAIIQEADNFILILLTAMSTKTFKNHVPAVKLGKEIKKILDDHNKKFKEQISYGISVNSGDLILKKEGANIKFTPLGSSTNLSRKLADISKGEIFLSEDFYKKVMSEVKAIKQIEGNLNLYKLNELAERDTHKKFIQDFLKRQ